MKVTAHKVKLSKQDPQTQRAENKNNPVVNENYFHVKNIFN